MSASQKGIGKWIKATREGLLGMNQPKFARWLTQMTGEEVTSQIVARMENYGNPKACNPHKPPLEVLRAIAEVAPYEIGKGDSIPMLRLNSEKLNPGKRAVMTSSTRLLEVSDELAPSIFEEFTASVGQVQSFKNAGQGFPIFHYQPAVWHPGRLSQVPQESPLRFSISSPLPTKGTPFVVRVVSAASQPIADALVTAITQFSRYGSKGGQERTDSSGQAVLRFGNSESTQTVTVERLIVEASLSGYWSFCQLEVTLDSQEVYEVELQPVEVPHTTGIIANQYGLRRELGQAPVRVGVVDTGIDIDHPALDVVGGYALFEGDPPPGIYIDNGAGHGTHVAGLIGSSNPHCQGMAPEVRLMSYRVFPDTDNWTKPLTTPTSYIALAILKAVEDGCDIINLSIGGFPRGAGNCFVDRLVELVCKEAIEKGCLLVAAAGNNSCNRVSIPAGFQEVLGISAMGREGTFPANTAELYDLGEPCFPDDPPGDRFARFSNYCNREQDIQYITPGVGIISTIPGGGFGVMSGTSMACPIVSGIAANLLSHRPDIYSMARDRARTEAIIELLNDHLYDHQFGLAYQGAGRPMLV